MISKLLRSGSLRAAVGQGVAGVAFTVGNLLLARVMSPVEYGSYALVVAIFNIAQPIAPLGFDEALVRNHLRIGSSELLRVLATGVLLGLAAALMSGFAYTVPLVLCVLLALAVVTQGIAVVASASLRSNKADIRSILVFNGANWAVALSGLLGLVVPLRSASTALSILLAGCLLAAVLGWRSALRRQRPAQGAETKISSREVFSFVGIVAAAGVTVQLERLIAPHTVGVQALATFAVLASTVLFPFRMLRAGVGFSLVPRLRDAKTPNERTSLILRELAVVSSVVIVSTTGVLLLAAPVTHFLTAGRYQLTLSLILAGCLNGASKVIAGAPTAVVTALGTRRDVVILNAQVWLTMALGCVGGAIGARWGLEGLVVGVGVANIVGTLPSIGLAWRALHRTNRAGSLLPVDPVLSTSPPT